MDEEFTTFQANCFYLFDLGEQQALAQEKNSVRTAPKDVNVREEDVLGSGAGLPR